MNNEELVMEIRAGHRDLIGELYLDNYGTIRKFVKRYANADNFEDLCQEAYFGIVEAVENWKPEKHVSFMHYALYWIKYVVIRYLKKNESGISIPYHIYERKNQYKRFVDTYIKRYGKEPSREQIALHTGFSNEQIDDVKRAIQAENLASLYQRTVNAANDREELLLIDTLLDPDNQIEELLDRIEADELSAKMWSIVNSLPPVQAQVIKYRFYRGLTLYECGVELGVTTERVRVIEHQALIKMKNVYKKELRPYVDDYVYQQGLKGTGLRSFKNTFESSVERAAIKLDKLESKYEIG